MDFTVNNVSNNKIVAKKAYLADTFITRLKGLLGRKELKLNEALLIKPCNSVHTFGMKFNIDVIFLNQENKVIKVIKDMKPNKISPIIKGAKAVLELPSGTADSVYLRESHQLKIISNS